MRWVRGLVALIMLVLIGTFVSREGTSPGALHPVHAQVAELRGENSCTACHGGFFGTMAGACGECHKDIKAQQSSGKGIHGALEDANSCGRCHVEHRGASHDLTGDFSFAHAGFKNATHYDHRHGSANGVDLVGVHATLECKACHLNADEPLLSPGQKRYLGVERRCASCHDDEHKGLFGRDCQTCHGQDDEFKKAPGFEHDALGLVGKHGVAKCADCHEEEGPHSVNALRAATTDTDPAHADPTHSKRECAHCHDNPHEPGAEGPGSDLVYGDARDCGACHDPERFTPALVTSVDHERASFALLGPHAELSCKQCHDAEAPLAKRASLGFDLAPEACAECHSSPHSQGFVEAVKPARSMSGSAGGIESGACSVCHQFGDATFRAPDAEMLRKNHDGTGFPLSAPHDKTECRDCHGKGSPLRIETPRRRRNACIHCHEDPHGRQFDKGPSAGRCAACHTETTFRPTRLDVESHGETAFPLSGAHRAVSCNSCHEKDESGVRRFASTPASCVDCHLDPHISKFDGTDRPLTVRGKQSCARCHDTNSFQRSDWSKFDHRLWTGYALAGKHKEAACTDCHVRSKPKSGKRPFADASRVCTSCHTDPHVGQFRRRKGKRVDCSRCHNEEKGFAEHHFDHQKQSRFKLDEQHAALECSECHKPVAIGKGRKAIRYRPLGRECADCHVAGNRRKRSRKDNR